MTTHDLQCPRCLASMAAQSTSTSHLHRCQECEGAWVTAQTIAALLSERPNAQGALKRLTTALSEGTHSTLPCPECPKVHLWSHRFEGIEIDTCGSCSGIFFDAGELSQFLVQALTPKREPFLNRTVRESGGRRSYTAEVAADTLLGGIFEVILGTFQ